MNTTLNTAKKNNMKDHWDNISEQTERLNNSPWIVKNSAKMGYNYDNKKVDANFIHVTPRMAKNLYEVYIRHIERSNKLSKDKNYLRYGHGNLKVNSNIPWKLPRKNRKTTITISPAGLRQLNIWRKNQDDDLLKIKPRLRKGRIVFDFLMNQ